MIFKYKDCNKWPFIYVVFSNGSNLFWLKLLKRGFRHCFVILGNGENWIAIEATLSRTYINLITDQNYPDFLRKRGFTVIRSKIYPYFVSKMPKFAIFSCVELVKSVLGINSSKLQTPYSLYRFLHKPRKCS